MTGNPTGAHKQPHRAATGGRAPYMTRTVSVWCGACRELVDLTGNVYPGEGGGRRADDPVHITPAVWAEHDEQVHGMVRRG